MTGNKLNTATEKWLHASISDDLGTGLGMEDELAEEAAKRCVPVLLNLREKLRQCLDSTGAKAYNANIGKEMRIAVGADTNVAVDNILGYLVGTPPSLSPFHTKCCLAPLNCCEMHAALTSVSCRRMLIWISRASTVSFALGDLTR